MPNEHKKFKFTVTESHIKKGRVRNSRACPIALAIKDAVFFPGFRVDVGEGTIIISPDSVVVNGRWFAKTPRTVKRFIQKYDSEKFTESLKPFNFVLSFYFTI